MSLSTPGFLIFRAIDDGGSAFQRAASRVLKKPSAIYGIWYLPPHLPIAASQEALMYEICQCQFPS